MESQGLRVAATLAVSEDMALKLKSQSISNQIGNLIK